MKTTLNEIRKIHLSKASWKKLLRHLGKTEPDDESLPLLTVLESNGLEDTLFCFRAVDGFDREKRLLAVAFAREVEHLMPDAAKSALEVAERYANGLATEGELTQAYTADYAPAADADADNAVAEVAESAAYAYAYAADLYAADRSAADRSATVRSAARKTARSEMQAKQAEILKQFLRDAE